VRRIWGDTLKGFEEEQRLQTPLLLLEAFGFSSPLFSGSLSFLPSPLLHLGGPSRYRSELGAIAPSGCHRLLTFPSSPEGEVGIGE